LARGGKMAEIIVKHLEKIYPNGVKAVENVNIEMADGEFLVLLGPSGCGKSTILMMLAGLEEISSGEVYIDNVCVNDLTPKERDIGVVFQSYALIPNMNVYENIGFGLTIRKMNKKEKDLKIRAVAKILGIEEVLDRRPREISGGQKQRVAIGRCIVRGAKVLLFDEPLSNLDAKLRVQMRKELIKLHQMLKATIVYVTHDQVEAMTMATKIVVMKEGAVQQTGTPEEVFNRPSNVYVATFIGSPTMNILKGLFVIEQDQGCLRMNGGLVITLDDSKTAALKNDHRENSYILVGVRSERITPVEKQNSNLLSGKVKMVEKLGMEKYIYLQHGDETIIARTLKEAPKLGEMIKVHIDTNGMVFFDLSTEKRIEV
jgi:multiple sugar transport system ATP-binding protein